MCNERFALYNTSEAREYMTTPTRGLNHLVTSRRTPCNATMAARGGEWGSSVINGRKRTAAGTPRADRPQA